MCLLVLPLVQPHPPSRLHKRRLGRRVRVLQAVSEGGVLRAVSQWVASPFNAASSPTTAERSQAVSLATSFGSCGPTYAPPNMRRHQDRGSERFRRGLSSRAEGVPLRIGCKDSSRPGAPRTGCDRGSWEGSCGAFLKPSVAGLSPPSFAPGCDLSAPGGVPSATQGYPCIAHALRGYGNAPSSLRTSHATRVSVRSPDPHLWRSGTLSCVAPLPCNTDFLC
jgi:hypothetical protein